MAKLQGGVGVQVEEAPQGAPNLTIGIPGVPTQGSPRMVIAFRGSTDSNGINQHPRASVNTTWTVNAYISIVI